MDYRIFHARLSHSCRMAKRLLHPILCSKRKKEEEKYYGEQLEERNKTTPVLFPTMISEEGQTVIHCRTIKGFRLEPEEHRGRLFPILTHTPILLDDFQEPTLDMAQRVILLLFKISRKSRYLTPSTQQERNARNAW
jgi:hypothetical protein